MIVASQFLLVLSPEGQVKAKTNELKHACKVKYGCKSSEGLIPHVTLLSVLIGAIKEQAILNRLEKVASIIEPFKVEINGFGQFPLHTIFLKIVSIKEVLSLVKEISDSCGKDLSRPIFCREPHLTIAKDMSVNQFTAAWADYQNEQYQSSFFANEMVLLKRSILDNSKYEVVRRFTFQGLKKIESQLPLFGNG